jgi:phage/plasmid-associated DNA primase
MRLRSGSAIASHRAGKGTILKALSGLVGPSNVCAPTLSSLGAPFGLSPLLNRSVATITDARLSGRIDQAERYERKSVMITSNLVLSEWDRIFKDPMTTAAAIDRLVHHASII